MGTGWDTGGAAGADGQGQSQRTLQRQGMAPPRRSRLAAAPLLIGGGGGCLALSGPGRTRKLVSFPGEGLGRSLGRVGPRRPSTVIHSSCKFFIFLVYCQQVVRRMKVPNFIIDWHI